MSRFYFNLYDDDPVRPDEEGIDLPDAGAAQLEARLLAAELISEEMHGGKPFNPQHRIEIQDAHHHLVSVLKFGDMIASAH